MEEVHQKLFTSHSDTSPISPVLRRSPAKGEPLLALWEPASPERKNLRKDDLRAAEVAVARSRLVQGLTSSEISRLVATAVLLEARCGDTVLSAMEKAEAAIVVLSGTFAITTPDGLEVQRVGPESTVGDFSMLLLDIRYIVVTCVSVDGKCLRICRKDYQTCLGSRYTTFMQALMLTVERGLVVTCPYVDGSLMEATQGEGEEDEAALSDDEEGPEDLGLSPQTLAIFRYIKQRRSKLAALGVDCMSMPSWEEVSKFWNKVPEAQRRRMYFAVKALAKSAWSNGYCPHYDMPADALDDRCRTRGPPSCPSFVLRACDCNGSCAGRLVMRACFV